jgi:hypothetical protein
MPGQSVRRSAGPVLTARTAGADAIGGPVVGAAGDGVLLAKRDEEVQGG